MDAVVLAGGEASDSLAREFGVPTKALVPLSGRPMVSWIIEALSGSGVVDRVIYVGPPAELDPPPDLVLPPRGRILENLEAALGQARGDRVLVATADAPLISAEAVRYVVEKAPDAALVYPVVPKEAIEARWPGMRRTYARLRDGTFTGGNLILLDKALFAKALPMARRVVAMRKNPLAIARLIGFGVLVKLLLGRLSIADLEARVGRIFGVPMRALVVPYPEIGVDADEAEDLVWMQRALEGRDANR